MDTANINCNPYGLTLSFRYRSNGNGRLSNDCLAGIYDHDDSWNHNITKTLENEQHTWKLETIKNINFEATTIWIEFIAMASRDGAPPYWQNLDVDDIQII